MFTRDPNSHPRPSPASAPATSTRESRPATFRHNNETFITLSIKRARYFAPKCLKSPWIFQAPFLLGCLRVILTNRK